MARNRPYPYLPSEDVEAALRGRLPEEELPIEEMIEEGWAMDPEAEALGAYTNIASQVGQPTGTEGSEEIFQARGKIGGVSDEQAQRWYEQVQAENAKVKLEMLANEMLNSRKNLIDELYGGDDPALQNTKPIRDELTKIELKTLNEQLGDPEEWTPEQKLRAATLKINVARDARVKVENEKQANVQRLNDAVTQYNTGIAKQMQVLQGGMQAIQEKHIAEDEAAAGVMEAQAQAMAKGKPKEPAPVTWTTAARNLSNLFGKEDPMGNIIVTPELAGMHRIARKKLVELKKQGEMGPLEAVNVSEAFARHIDTRYWAWIDAPDRTEKDKKDFDKEFKARYGYIPTIRQR